MVSICRRSQGGNIQIILFIFLLIQGLSVYGGYINNVTFSNTEIQKHQRKITEFVKIAGLYLEDYRNEHLSAYLNSCRLINKNKICVSKFYGEWRYSKQRGQFRPDGTPLIYLGDALKAIGFPESYIYCIEISGEIKKKVR